MRILVLLLLLVTIFQQDSFAQARIELLKKGDMHYKKKQYSEAVEAYERLNESRIGNKIMGPNARVNLANCYRALDEPFKAYALYVKYANAVKPYRPEVMLQYGQVLMSLGRYDDAKAMFVDYSKLAPEDYTPVQLVEQCDRIKDIVPVFERVTVNTQTLVNDSSSKEMAAAYYGDAIIWSGNRLDEKDISEWKSTGYFSLRVTGLDTEGNMKESMPLANVINAPEKHTGPATFSRDGLTMYFSQSTISNTGEKSLMLFESKYRNNKWSEPEVLPFNIKGKNFTHPSLSADGRQLYFASDQKGTFGGLDVWVAVYEGGRWLPPQNLGKEVNTAYDDAWPFSHPDGDVYFSSKGHSGYGGYDIFRTRPLGDGNWFEAENMGKPFNSSFSDISFILSDNQTNGFFTSNRDESYDIFRFILDDAEPQILPSDVKPRATIGLSEFDPNSMDGLDSNFPDEMGGMNAGIDVDSAINSTLSGGGVPNTEGDNSGFDALDDGGISSAIDNGVEGESTTELTGAIRLVVQLTLVENGSEAILKGAKVILTNIYSGRTQELTADRNGQVLLDLAPNQRYKIRGERTGYFVAEMPVVTIGATQSERISAKLPLIKK